MKRLLLIIILSLCGGAAFFLIYGELHDRFSLDNIQYDNLAEGAYGADDAMAATLLAGRSYDYIGRGHQSYVFAINGTPFVIKFVRFNYLKPTALNRFLMQLPLIGPRYQAEQQSKEKRFWRVFHGYQAAFVKNNASSGLLYIHLKKGGLPGLNITVTDELGFHHPVSLNETAFVIQKRATPTRDVFTALLNEKRVDLVKVRIRALFDMYMTDYKAGLYDDDHNLLINTGFAGDTPIRMDLGKVKETDEISNPAIYEPDLLKIAKKRLYGWFSKYYPQYSEEIRLDMESKLSELFGRKVTLDV
jgi:hypothetical protein